MLIIRLLISHLFVLSTFICEAQDTLKYPKKSFLRKNQNWQIDVPVWIPGFRGEYSQGEIGLETFHIEEDKDKIGEKILRWLFPTQSYLELYFKGRVQFQKGRFISSLDAISGKFGASVRFRFTNKEIVQASLSATVPRFIIGYYLYEFENDRHNFKLGVTGYTGFRWFFVRISSKTNDIINNLNINPKWGDGIIGLKVPVSFHRWKFVLQGDYGGFGWDNNQSFSLQFNTSYRVGKWFSVRLGWLDADIKHKANIDGEDVKLNLHFSGPAAGVSFHF